MADIAVVDVIVSPATVVEIADVGAPGPPGPAGPAGPAGATGPAGPAGTVPTDSLALSQSIAIGTTPAQSGAVRLANHEEITARNAANTADIRIIRVRNDNVVEIGSASQYTQLFGPIIFFDGGINALRGILRFQELAPSGVPGANEAFVWLQDNGAGKSQLMIQFATGPAIAIATQA